MSSALSETAAYLDRRLRGDSSGVTVGYAGGTTTWTLPYAVAVDGSEGTLTVCVNATGQILSTTRPSPTTIAAVGDYHTTDVVIGVLYPFLVRLSTLYQRDRDGNAISSGRLSIRRLLARFGTLVSATATVWLQAGQRYSYTKTNSRAKAGVLSIPVNAVNDTTRIEISSTTPGACALSELEWEAQYAARRR